MSRHPQQQARMKRPSLEPKGNPVSAKHVWTAVLVIALLAGCATSEDVTGTTPESADFDADETAEEEVEPATEPDPEPEPEDDREHVVTFDPLVWTDAGLELLVHGAAVTSRELVAERMAEEFMDAEEMFDERVAAFLTLEVEAVNGTDQVIDWYPNQGQIVVGQEQREADLLLSGEVGRFEWQPGTRQRDRVIFALHSDYDLVVEQGEARFLVSAASSSETFDPVGSDADVTVTW